MKKMFICLIGSLIVCQATVAGELEDNCGCGLGTMLLEGNDGMIFQVAATFTNGICTNQAIGITFGTLGCEQPISIVDNRQLQIFVADNMDNLAKDMAMGAGESLATVAEIIRVDAVRKDKFYAELQANFSTIYASPDVTHTDVIAGIAKIYQRI